MAVIPKFNGKMENSHITTTRTLLRSSLSHFFGMGWARFSFDDVRIVGITHWALPFGLFARRREVGVLL